MSNELIQVKTESGMVATAQNFLKENGGLVLPPNYDAMGAVKSLYLAFTQLSDKNNNPASKVCSPESVQQAVCTMVAKGLDPRKNQCYPIVYGSTLVLQEGAFGKVKEAKSAYADLVEINSSVIRQGDKVKISKVNGRTIVEHETSWENMGNEIIGAYATAVFADGSTMSDIMTKKDIDKSRSKSKNGGAVYKDFPEEMSKRTVESRLAKYIINTSDDSSKFAEQLKGHLMEAEYEVLDEDNGVIVEDVNSAMGEPTTPIVEAAVDELSPLPDLEEQTETDGEGWFEIPYGEYSTNKDLYEKKPDSYDKTKKTIWVRRV